MECAYLAEVMRQKGWNTYWLGKNHNVAEDEFHLGASKRNWPLMRGFDRFYGFFGGECDQWYPTLVEDNGYVKQPYTPKEGYHLAKDLVDKAIRYIRDSKAAAPEKPWFMFFCPAPIMHLTMFPKNGLTSTRVSSTTVTKPTGPGFFLA